MTLFTIDKDGKFSAFHEKKQDTENKELDLVTIIEKNPESVIQQGKILIIGQNRLTEGDQYIDFLGLDCYGNTVIIDIPGVKATRKSLIKLIEKAAFVNELDYADLNAIYKKFNEDKSDLQSAFTNFFNTEEETISWNGSSRLVMVSQRVTPEVKLSATYLRKNGLDISCVIFNYLNYNDDTKMISREFVVGEEEFQKTEIKSFATKSEPLTDKEKFFQSLDDEGLLIFSALFDFASNEDLVFNWTSQGFSLNVMVDNEPIGLCYGYAQDSLLNQSIYTSFDQILKKVSNAEEVVAVFITRIEELNLFNQTRSSFRWDIAEDATIDEITRFFDVLKEIAEKIKNNGLIGVEADPMPMEI